jgi:hypothetical protein
MCIFCVVVSLKTDVKRRVVERALFEAEAKLV